MNDITCRFCTNEMSVEGITTHVNRYSCELCSFNYVMDSGYISEETLIISGHEVWLEFYDEYDTHSINIADKDLLGDVLIYKEFTDWQKRYSKEELSAILIRELKLLSIS